MLLSKDQVALKLIGFVLEYAIGGPAISEDTDGKVKFDACKR